jgi:hypothetical protein
MAITYSIEIGSPATTADVSDVLARTIDARQLAMAGHGSRLDGDGTALVGGGLVSAHTRSPLPFPDPKEEVFGFVPVVFVSFRMTHPEFIIEQKHDMVILLAAALAGVDGDAWFGFQGEITYLTRIAGRIAVDTGKDFWTPGLLALLPPHDSAVLENM